MTWRIKVCTPLFGLSLFGIGFRLAADTILRELGGDNSRVAPNRDFDELHDSMKRDSGLSLRFMANRGIGRLDRVWSEGAVAGLMYGHPF